MNSFTSIYLGSLQAGMTKAAMSQTVKNLIGTSVGAGVGAGLGGGIGQMIAGDGGGLMGGAIGLGAGGVGGLAIASSGGANDELNGAMEKQRAEIMARAAAGEPISAGDKANLEYIDYALSQSKVASQKNAGKGKLFGAIGTATGGILLGKRHAAAIQDMLPSYTAAGAGGGAALGAVLGALKDSSVVKLDPNALAVMNPEQRASAQEIHANERKKEMARRLVGGALKGGLGGAAIGALGATGQGITQGIMEEGYPGVLSALMNRPK